MVQKWSGGMNGARLVLLFSVVCIFSWSDRIHAENLPYDPDIDGEFQIRELSNFNNDKTANKLLVFENSKHLDSDISDLDDIDFVDAQWTAKPKVRSYKSYKNFNQNFKTKNYTINQSNNNPRMFSNEKEIEVSETNVETSDKEIDYEDQMYDFEQMGPEAEESQYMTEAVTQAITTEMDFEATTDEDEMLRRMHRRWRRAVIQVTVTTPEPSSTTSPPDACVYPSYYNPETGNCSCPAGTEGTTCDTAMDPDVEASQDLATNTFSGSALGTYDNTDRAEFEIEFTKQLRDRPGFRRVYVHPITYDPETGYSTITWDVFYDSAVEPDETWQLSSVVGYITSNRTPLNVNVQQVIWQQNATLTVTEDDGTIQSIPISADRTSQICYIYDKLGSCTNGGICSNTTGEPVCSCATGYHGKYCNVRIEHLDETDLLPILIPVLGGVAGLVLLCSCCFVFARRLNKGDDESTVSSVPHSALAVPKLFFHDTNWKQFDRGPRLFVEEIWEERPVVDYERVVIEEETEPDYIVREPVYRYRVEDGSEESEQIIRESSTESSTSSTRGTWIDNASKLGDNFHIDRPDYF